MKILALHIRDTKNAGDRASCPLDYFAFPGHEIIFGDMRQPPNCEPGMVIYGGGSITASPDFHRWLGLTVAWGVGHNERGVSRVAELMTAEHLRASAFCDAYFPRDRVPAFADNWAPCASCMHPVFDEIAAPRHKVVRYSAARRINVADGSAPHMTNEDGSIEEAVRFLASGETVITSSYHGAYWARLLGRNVQLAPWGSKFSYIPTISLAECREMNQRVYQKVLALANNKELR